MGNVVLSWVNIFVMSALWLLYLKLVETYNMLIVNSKRALLFHRRSLLFILQEPETNLHRWLSTYLATTPALQFSSLSFGQIENKTSQGLYFPALTTLLSNPLRFSSSQLLATSNFSYTHFGHDMVSGYKLFKMKKGTTLHVHERHCTGR